MSTLQLFEPAVTDSFSGGQDVSHAIPAKEILTLEEAKRLLSSENPCDAANGFRLVHDSTERLREITGDEWRSRIIPWLRRSEIWNLLMEDPITSRSIQRPRGYAGDAPLIDLL